MQEQGKQIRDGSAEADLVLRRFNDTSVEYPQDRLIHEIFEEQVARAPDACALILGQHRLSYGQLNAKANQVAHRLIARGLKPDERVGICAERGVEMIVGMLAVLKAGGAYVPLDPKYPHDRLMFMCKDSSLVALLTPSGLLDEVSAWGLPSDLLDKESPQAFDNPRVPELTARHLAYVIYTSGSSGQPKGVMVEHRSVIRLVVNARYAEITSEDCFAHCASPSFDAATWEIWGALLNGARVLIVPQRELLSAVLFNDLLVEHAVTAMFLTVGLFHRYVDKLEQAFGKLRHLLVGGDVLVPSMAARALAKTSRPRHLYNAYGPTETTTFATTFEIAPEATVTGALPIGRPITNSQVYVLDEDGAPLPVGAVGEIYIGGPGVARGYLNRPELTSDRFVDDPFGNAHDGKLYKTGDLGRWRADGNLEFLGRKDFQVKVRGFRVEPGEIETALQRHEAVKQALVIAREDGPEEKRLVAYIVSERPSDEESRLLSELQDSLVRTLPQYMVPSAFVLLDELPLTPNGKVDRAALPAPHDWQWRRADYVPPRTSVESTLAEVWAQRLKLEQVGVDDNFFELGGDSLVGLALIADVAERLGIPDLSVTQILDHPTVREMAQFIEAAAADSYKPF